uniref:Uncharacterized protein n=1 Tax=Triticum urartu TaxID=4572 RepID=A0A8R7V461_TRIUA
MVAEREDLLRRRRARVQVRQGAPRRVGGGRQGVPAVRGAEAQRQELGDAHRERPGDAAQGQQLLHLRPAGPLRQEHEARRQGLVDPSIWLHNVRKAYRPGYIIIKQCLHAWPGRRLTVRVLLGSRVNLFVSRIGVVTCIRNLIYH